MTENEKSGIKLVYIIIASLLIKNTTPLNVTDCINCNKHGVYCHL